MRTVAALAFIAAVAAGALWLAQSDTVARGDVIAADLMKTASPAVAKLTCDERIPLGPDGAVFQCHLELKDGSTQLVEVTMNRKGHTSSRVLGSTAPAAKHGEAGDPWND